MITFDDIVEAILSRHLYTIRRSVVEDDLRVILPLIADALKEGIEQASDPRASVGWIQASDFVREMGK